MQKRYLCECDEEMFALLWIVNHDVADKNVSVLILDTKDADCN